jgi:hypothetical protein
VVRAQLKEGERGNYISYMSIPLIHLVNTKKKKKKKKSLGMYKFILALMYVPLFLI